MDRLIQFVRSYQLAPDLKRRNDLGLLIISEIAPALSRFVAIRYRDSNRDDVIQDVLCGIIRGLDTFSAKSDAQFWGWCHQIARNKVADVHRRNSKEIIAYIGDEMLSALGPVGWPEEITEILEVVRHHAPDEFDLIVEHYLVGFDWESLARHFGGTAGSVRMRVKRALERVKSNL